MRLVTSDFSAMVSPNWISIVLLSIGLVSHKETLHVHGALEWVRWHSVGHLIPYIEAWVLDIWRAGVYCQKSPQ